MNYQKGFVISLIISIIAILAIGGGYWYYKTSYFPPNLIDRVNIVGGDSDIHGCKASAGYSWCEVKNKCLRPWEEKCEATSTQPSITVMSPNGGDKYLINVKTFHSYMKIPCIKLKKCKNKKEMHF